MRQQGQQPRSWTVVLIRGALALGVLLIVVWATQLRPRTDASTLERDIAGKLHSAQARCSDQTRNGSRWTCLVGSPPATRCVVVDVSLTGDWTLERRPAHCRHP
jgi:hypothetical protein